MSAKFLTDYYKVKGIAVPTLHVVLGSGLAPVFYEMKLSKGWTLKASLPFEEVPGLLGATAPGHKGIFRYFENQKSKKILCFQVGRLHGYEGIAPRQVVKPLVSAKEAGTKVFLLTNAAGSLNPKFKVGSLMFIQDQVNLSGQNPLTGSNPVGEDGRVLGPRFVDMSEPYNLKLNAQLKKMCQNKKLKCHAGIYLGLAGPTFETPSEVRLFSKWGMGSVGMSTVCETIALKHMGAEVAGVSVISNMGTGLVKGKMDHSKVESEVAKVAPSLVAAIFDFAQRAV